MTHSIDTVVIGAGQAGLAVSNRLTAAGRDHVVLERGRVAQRWRSETWDSLHLLTPNWFNTLPMWRYRGGDPDGFMSAAGFARHLAAYARAFAAPVEEDAPVESVRRRGDGFEVVAGATCWRANHVVIATGWCDRPAIPDISRTISAGIDQIAPAAYRDPSQLGSGGVLVVGASATGIQLADELRRAGRDVTLAVGGHSRMPRRYRGMDVFWWFDRIGLLDKTIDEQPDAFRARREPSLQVVGRPDQGNLDLATVQAAGVRLTGRLLAVDGDRARFAPDLAATVAAGNARMNRVLHQIDRYVDEHGLAREVLEAEPLEPVTVGAAPDELDLAAAGITTVVWATGYRRVYDWLDVPVLDARGEIRQRRGVTPMPGLYVLGQRFQYRRNSNFIGGVGADAAFVADHITGSVSFDPHRGAFAAN
jgi:putative flavoprotein involved in K+ transport